MNLKSVRALSPSRILMIPADVVRQYFSADAAFARALAIELAFAYRSVVKELENQKLRSSLERLANWLLTNDRETGATGKFKLPFDKDTGRAAGHCARSFIAIIRFAERVPRRRQRIIHRIERQGRLNQTCTASVTIDDPTI